MPINTKKLAYIALFTSISVVFNIFSIQMNGTSNYLSFVYIPCFFAGVFFGPWWGFAVGFIADLLGGLIAPKGAYNPMIGLASGLLGMIPGLIFKIKYLKPKIKILLSFIMVLIICTSGLNTYALYLLYAAGKGKTFYAYLIVRLPYQAIAVLVNLIITYLIYSPINKLYFNTKKDDNRKL